MTWILVKLGIRLLAFILVFWFATKKNPKVKIQPRWAIPLVAGLFGLFNTGLYWLMKPVLNIATFGAVALAMPLVINGLLLYATARAVEKKKWLQFEGWFATVWLALILTAAHGVLWFGLDYIPANV
ncbi:MAG TPA: phage holin family protein [Kofleriaceae bacterium]|jgi:hypothetical protein|nr:phage holin family protein [Kofleriaceae bacterium]